MRLLILSLLMCVSCGRTKEATATVFLPANVWNRTDSLWDLSEFRYTVKKYDTDRVIFSSLIYTTVKPNTEDKIMIPLVIPASRLIKYFTVEFFDSTNTVIHTRVISR